MIRSVALISGAVCVFVSAIGVPAQAQETKVRRIGAWDVVAINEKGAFNRCAAQMSSGSGALRIAYIVNGAWSVSFPGFGGRGQHVGAARLNALQAPQVLFTDHGPRASAPLSPRWVDEFRRGGTLGIAVARRNFAWDMRDTGPVLGAVQDCVNQRRGVAAPISPPRMAGFAHPRAHGYAPPPPPVYVAAPPPPNPAQPRPGYAPAYVPPAQQAAPMSDPVAVLKYVYANIDKPRAEPFSQKLAGLRAAAIKKSEEIKEPVSGLDFDYALNAQDAEPGTAKSVKYQILGQDARRASIKVSLKNGQPIELRYDLVFENNQWMIDEVWQIGGDAWALSDLYKEGAAGK
jgi:hypothetical protein